MDDGRPLFRPGGGQGLGDLVRPDGDRRHAEGLDRRPEVGLLEVDGERLAEPVPLVGAQDPVAAVVHEQELRAQAVLAGGGDAARCALIDTLDLFGIGYSWGGFESLAVPIDPQRHRTATVPDFAGPLVRLQIGLEDADDLIADLERGLAAWRAAQA